MKKVAILLSFAVLFAVSCAKSDLETQQVPNVSSTPCKQEVLKSSGLSDKSDKVDVKFTSKGVQITHYNFEVPCDFTTVNVTHTFVNGVLNITQQGLPNQANCVCHSDVSYTIEGISQNEVNVIFINGEQVYCHNVTGNEKLCLYLKSGFIDKTLPVINEFLAGLPSSNSFSEDEQNLQALAKWLKSNSCVIDATILCVSCIKTLPLQSEISFSFKEGEVTKVVTLDISMTKPLKARICSVIEESNVTLKNTESYSRTFVVGDEEGALIMYQAQHYEKSELVRDASTNMNVEYRYKPTANFVGNDNVGLEVYYNKTGEPSSAYIEIVRINFTITN